MSQVFVMLNGFSKSGKTVLAERICQTFPRTIVRIDSATIHDFLNSKYDIFKDDNSIFGSAFKLRDKSTKALQDAIIDVLVTNGVNVILDACNSKAEKRERIINKIKHLSPNCKTMIISIDVDEVNLLKRLNDLDDESEASGNKRVWVDLYQKVQKPSFSAPKIDEADVVIKYTGSIEEYDKITKTVSEITGIRRLLKKV